MPLVFQTNCKLALLYCMLIVIPLTASAVEDAKNPGMQTDITLSELIFRSSEGFSDVENADLNGLLERIGDARLVLLGEASHGTAEFYDMRARITRELVTRKGFNIIAAEMNWPDATVLDHFIRGEGERPQVTYKAFSGFASWMWSNSSLLEFLRWLKNHNHQLAPAASRVAFYGLDIYNLSGSIESVLQYLQQVDHEMAQTASWHYHCLSPWAGDPTAYSRFMEFDKAHGCERDVRAVLDNLLSNRQRYRQIDAQRFFSAEQSARQVILSEYYYRTRFQDVVNPWNLRDESMFRTLLSILQHHGKSSKVIVWAHNTHIGDARATDMRANGEINLGQRVREIFADQAYLVGLGTDHGTVAAATEWGGPLEIMNVPPAHKDSYEHLFHQVEKDNFLLPLRDPLNARTRQELLAARLQRGIGITYGPDPEHEMKYHYYYASLPEQFDEYIWFDETRAVAPLK
jgi:protein-L-isoaspartate(D-aspartate) O-methyltransferase